MLSFLSKLRKRSRAELRERAGQKASALLEAYGLLPSAREPTDRELGALFYPALFPSGLDPERLRAHFRRRQEPAFFPGVRDGASAAALRTPRWSPALADLRSAADRIVRGEYDLLGHPGLSFGSPIDWHLDPTTGRRAPRTHWSRIPYLDVEVAGDHKVVWEVNRHQHFVVLGRAYQATADATYATCFIQQLDSWMDENPPKVGINWASSLEIAYRAMSWIWALELFRDAAELTSHILARAIKYLHLHGRHLERYLSTYFSPNTHLTGEGLGLLYLGSWLPELRRSVTWRTLGWDILARELPRQVHEDGVYFEQATYYHRYTVDIYLHAMLVARHLDQPVPQPLIERLSLALTHLADLTRPDGSIPFIGDDDGGRLIALEERPPSDVRAALATASVVLGRPELARVAGGATEEVLWLLGPEGASVADVGASAAPPAHLSRLYAAGGYAITRDGWGGTANHAVIDCGPHGTMNCGHAHSDALSIEISALGCPVIIDPGTFTYTGSAEDRDRFRHSAAHNTVTVDGASASVPSGPFAWASRADVSVEQWWSGALVDHFAGSHEGFALLSDPAIHRRRVLFVRSGYWVIIDSIDGVGRSEVVGHYHLAIGSRVVTLSSRSAAITLPDCPQLDRLVFSVAGDVDSLEWTEDWVSPAYGVKRLAPAARVTSRGTGPRTMVTVIVPCADGVSASIREEPCEDGRAISVERAGDHDLLLFRTGGVVRAMGIAMSADAALVRRPSPTAEITHVALFGADAWLETARCRFTAVGSAEIERAGDGWSVKGGGQVGERQASAE